MRIPKGYTEHTYILLAISTNHTRKKRNTGTKTEQNCSCLGCWVSRDTRSYLDAAE